MLLHGSSKAFTDLRFNYLSTLTDGDLISDLNGSKDFQVLNLYSGFWYGIIVI